MFLGSVNALEKEVYVYSVIRGGSVSRFCQRPINHFHRLIICDMIKGNESDVADIVVEILAKKEVKFFGFILFSVFSLYKKKRY